VVLGHEAWITRFNSDPRVVGRSVLVNGEAATVLGVMAKGFRFPANQDIWVARRDDRPRYPDRAQSPTVQVVGRLQEGVSRDQAEREMAVIAARLAQTYPASNQGVTTRFRTFVEDDTGPELIAVFGAMQVATIFVLLIAIANVANLLLTRATMRTREAAVRTALGATRLRVALPFFAETLVLSAAGAAIGTGIAWVGVRMFDTATQGVGKPYYMEFALDLPVLAFVAGVTLLTAFLASAAPAFHVLKTDVHSTLKDDSRGSTGVLGGRLTRVLVVSEIALSCALLVGAGLMVKSIVKVRTFEYPFRTENIITARLGLFETSYPTPESRRSFYRDLEGRLAALPGAGSVTLATGLPLNTGGSRIGIEGQVYATARDYPEAQNTSITPGYFTVFGTSLLEGRNFTAGDDAGSLPVAIVNRAFVARFFPDGVALGRRFAEASGDTLGTWRTIVGVVPNLRMEGVDPDRPDSSGYYVPLAQRDPRFVSLAIHAEGAQATTLLPAVRQAVQALDPNLPIYNADTMDALARQATWFINVFGTLFIVFGAAALFMATVGLYGVLSFSVSRRMKEMGIRMALGASGRDVIRLVMRQGGRQLAIGLALGLVVAFGLTRVIGLLMFEVKPQDPPVFGLVVVLIAAVGMLASLVPARRATLAEPSQVLHYE